MEGASGTEVEGECERLRTEVGERTYKNSDWYSFGISSPRWSQFCDLLALRSLREPKGNPRSDRDGSWYPNPSMPTTCFPQSPAFALPASSPILSIFTGACCPQPAVCMRWIFALAEAAEGSIPPAS